MKKPVDAEGHEVKVGNILWVAGERPQRQKVVGIEQQGEEAGQVYLVPANGDEPGPFADLPMHAWRGLLVR